MKKFVKNLLFGAGIAAAGLIVYSLWKGAEEPVVVRDANVEPPAATPTKEYVERRRQQIRDAAEEKRAVRQEAAQEETVQDGAAQEEAPDTVPVEAAASEQASKRQEEQ